MLRRFDRSLAYKTNERNGLKGCLVIFRSHSVQMICFVTEWRFGSLQNCVFIQYYISHFLLQRLEQTSEENAFCSICGISEERNPVGCWNVTLVILGAGGKFRSAWLCQQSYWNQNMSVRASVRVPNICLRNARIFFFFSNFSFFLLFLIFFFNKKKLSVFFFLRFSFSFSLT